MKKSTLIILLFAVTCLIIFATNTHAEFSKVSLQAVDPETGLPEDIGKIADLSHNLTSEEYLKKEWGIIFKENKFFKPFYEAYTKISPYTDVFFKYTIGMTPSLSWLFALTFFIWLTFLIYLYRILSVFSESSRIIIFAITLLIMTLLSIEGLDIKIGLFLSMAILLFVVLLSIKTNVLVALLASIIIPFVLTAFISPIVLSTILKDYKPIQMLGLPKFIALSIIGLIALSKIWWVQLIIVGLVILGLIVFDSYSGKIEAFTKKIKEKMAKKEEEMNRGLLRKDVKTIGEVTKALEGK